MYITKSLETAAQAPACAHGGKDLVGVANRCRFGRTGRATQNPSPTSVAGLIDDENHCIDHQLQEPRV